jgi:hypothetical protein
MHRLMADDRSLLACPANGARDQLLFDGQELGGGPAALLQCPVGDDADRPLSHEPVRQLLQLGPADAGQAGAEGDQDIRAGEGGHLGGQPVRTSEPIEQLTGHRSGHHGVLVAVGCPTGHLPDEGVRVHATLGRLLTPSRLAMTRWVCNSGSPSLEVQWSKPTASTSCPATCWTPPWPRRAPRCSSR